MFRKKVFPEHIDDGFAIYQVALSILSEQVDSKRAIRLVGVCVSHLMKNSRQMNLFADERRMNLLKATDAINDRYGEFIAWPDEC